MRHASCAKEPVRQCERMRDRVGTRSDYPIGLRFVNEWRTASRIEGATRASWCVGKGLASSRTRCSGYSEDGGR